MFDSIGIKWFIKSSILKTCTVTLQASTFDKVFGGYKRCHKQEAMSQDSSSQESEIVYIYPTRTARDRFELTKEKDLTHETLTGEPVNRKCDGKFGFYILYFVWAIVVGLTCKYKLKWKHFITINFTT